MRALRGIRSVPPRTVSATLAAIAVLTTVAGCGGTDPTLSVEETPVMLPSPPPSTGPEAAELTATGGPLEAGRYTRAGFEPAITIELDGSWQAVQLANGFFDVQQDSGSPDVIAVQFARPSGIFRSGGSSEAVDSAEAAVNLVEANPDLAVVESSASRIGGLEGSQVTVENAGVAHARVMQVPPGALGIDPGRRLWIAFVDTPDGLLAIMVGGSVATWDEALAAAESVLESVRIGP